MNYWRAPIENHWLFVMDSWFWHTADIVLNLNNLLYHFL
jgi:hypothetical protein